MGSAALSSAPLVFASNYEEKILLNRTYAPQTFSVNDQINLALIGSGIIGIHEQQLH